MSGELAPGICGGEKSLEGYLRYMGVQSLEELEEEQLCIFPVRTNGKERCERPSAAAA